MKNSKQIVSIIFSIFLFIAGLFIAQFGVHEKLSFKDTRAPLIYSLQNFENNIINSKDFESFFSSNAQNSSQTLRRSQNNFPSFNGHASIFDTKFKQLQKYFCYKSYLNFKKIRISFLGFEIQPNAPPESSEA